MPIFIFIQSNIDAIFEVAFGLIDNIFLGSYSLTIFNI
jgi:hypothetical protein